MSYKISKELFEAVYNEELANIEIGKTSIVAYIIDGTEFTEDINDFFFKCKEFALKQGYYITSDLLDVKIHPIEYGSIKMHHTVCIDIVSNIKEWDLSKHYVANSEQQGVFDACQWILDNKDR